MKGRAGLEQNSRAEGMVLKKRLRPQNFLQLQWQLLGRSDLRVRRLAAPAISPRTKE
jgi:hypothetical protein